MNKRNFLVDRVGFEPTKPKQQIYSLPDLTTCIPILMLYPPVMYHRGLEPRTARLKVECSAS